MKKHILIDCDPGTDDAQAIILALRSSNLCEVEAITSVVGNTSEEHVSNNIGRILKLLEKKVAVYRGCTLSLTGNPCLSDDYHGVDGLGDVEDYPGSDYPFQEQHASIHIVDAARKYKGELIIVALGPLTNIAIALQLDLQLAENVQEVVIMGGNTTGQGNVTACAEFNFYADPEAAECVLKCLSHKITLIPLELCKQMGYDWDWYKENVLGSKGIGAQFIGNIEKVVVKRMLDNSFPAYCQWDVLAMVAALNPKAIVKYEMKVARVELAGKNTRGQVYFPTEDQQQPKLKIAVDMDRQILDESNKVILA